MSRYFLSVICLVAVLDLPGHARALEIPAGSPAFVTKGFAIIRKAPGPDFPLLTVVPPSTAVTVDSCSTYWSVGWCEVTYQGWTGSMHSSLLEVARTARRAATETRSDAPHGNLLRAERNYLTQQRAYAAAREKLKNLGETEARKEKASLAKTGQWIEPDAAWRRQTALQRKVSRLRRSVDHARAQFFNAEIRAASAAQADQPGSIWPSWLPRY